jgi:hypothetical protein
MDLHVAKFVMLGGALVFVLAVLVVPSTMVANPYLV